VTLALTVAGWAAAAGLLAVVLRQRRLRTWTVASLARISHELRGPLGSLGLVVASIGRGRQAVVGGPTVPASLRAAQLELARVASVLADLDALSTGCRRPPGAPRALEAVDLHQLATDSVQGWLPFAERHGVRLLPPPPTAQPPVVFGDPGRLAQASGNLIANAVEHGGGVVVVRCRCMAATVRLEVADDGPGLPRPVEEIIRGGSAGRRGHGLAVAAAVARAHGGRLAGAPARVGARLVIELPRGLG
jgi:signal transduction histidine kinase